MNESYDVAIIGAGVHGAAAAFHLAERGIRTLVLEKGSPAGGPTGRSSAVCRAFYTNDFLARVAKEALEFFADFEARTGGDAGFRRTGALFLHPPADSEALIESAAQLNRIGTKVEVLTANEIGERFPQLSTEGVAHGAWEPDAGYADPAGTTTGLLAAARTMGVVSRSRVEVTSIDPSGASSQLQLSDGTRIAAAKVLIAAGPWSKPLAARVGADLPLGVERHIVATCSWGKAEPIPFVFADLPQSYYCKPEGTTQFLLGPLHEEPPVDPDDFDESVSDQEVASLANALIARVPSMVEAEPRGGWASLYDVSPDWQPVIGEIADGVFIDAGTSGHGFKLAPALGRHVAELVLGESSDDGIKQFRPSRFDEGQLIPGGYGTAKILG